MIHISIADSNYETGVLQPKHAHDLLLFNLISRIDYNATVVTYRSRQLIHKAPPFLFFL